MTNQAKPTPGAWRDHVMVLSRNDQKSLLRQENTIVRRGRDVIAMVFGVTSDEEKANAALIAEAGAVHHETGLTPRELQEQRYLLREVLHGELEALRKDIAALISPGSTLLYHRYDRVKEVLSQTAPPRQAAIAKARGGEA